MTLNRTLTHPHDSCTDFKPKYVFGGGIGTSKISIDSQHATTVATKVYTSTKLRLYGA